MLVAASRLGKDLARSENEAHANRDTPREASRIVLEVSWNTGVCD
jgi:hypothetical protein